VKRPTPWALGAVLVGGGLCAQQWQLPPLGAIEYERTAKYGGSAVVDRETEARAAPVSSRVPERYFPSVLPASWLCAGELDADRHGPVGPVRDLRDVLRAVALDLGGGSASRSFDRVVPYGDLAVSGAWRAQDGGERLTAKVTGRPPSGQRGEDRATTDRLRAFCVRRATGTLTLTRTVDFTSGLVRSFRGEIDLVVDEGDRQFRRVRSEDAWELVAVRDNQDFDFRKRVAAAIAKGAEFVKQDLAASPAYLDGKVTDERSYGSGRLALALLTLLHAHVRADDPVVQQGFAELRRRRLVDSYSLAAALMAMAALGGAPGGQLGEPERKAAAKWLEQLLGNVDPRVDRAELLRFNYAAGPRYDTSVQQYGLLGLCAAQRCGLPVDGGAFAAAARQLLAVQAPSGGRTTLAKVTYNDLAAAAGGVPEPQLQPAAARGFAYEEPTEPPFGSMTAAGLSGLVLARIGMQAAGHEDRALGKKVDEAVRDGFAWLADNFSVRCNPGWAERGRFHWYYWLYCLERSCELDRIARLGGRDWYYEGSLQLIAQQQKNGAFRSGGGDTMQIDATCFAVLFLAKAAGQAAVTQR
jgi:hypothetical protein